MKKKLTLAPGVVFDEEPHEYHLNGKRLFGITGLIATRMGLRMPDTFTGEVRDDGLHVHKAIQNWLDNDTWESIHPGALWIKQYLTERYEKAQECCHAEVLVSDMKKYASSVDILAMTGKWDVEIFDIKRSFKRPYVSWQTSVYKYFIEKHTKLRVTKMFCIAVKDRTVYPLQPYPVEDVEKLLYGED